MFKKPLRVLKILLLMVFFFQSSPIAFADPLLLSDAEMQKLKAYFPNDSEENHRIWQGDPLAIRLPLNKEKRLVFQAPVSVDVKSALTGDQLQVINNDKSVYLTALKPFSKTRIYITLQDSQKVILVDLEVANTDTPQDDTTVYIDRKSSESSLLQKNNRTNPVKPIVSATINNRTTVSDSQSNDASYVTAFQPSEGDTYVALIRYAWQQLYAPMRLFSNPLGIRRASMKTERLESFLINGDKVIAHPLASWSLNTIYITAIRLRNKYPYPIHLTIPHDLCGDWIGAVLYPKASLGGTGNKLSDSTTLFVLSKLPFNQAEEICHAGA